MSHMPEKNPETWLIVMAWLSQHAPTITAGLLSALVGLVRVIYGGGPWREALLEALLCTLVTIGLIPVIQYLGLPQNLATTVGIFVGYLGVKKVASLADRFTDFKLPKRQE